MGATPIHADAALPAVEPVTALRVVGRNVELLLSPAQASFTLGGAASPEVDVTLDGDGVSRLHVILQRKGPKLRVLDQRSTNGTYYRDRFDPDFELAPGDVFEVTRRIKLIALDEHLRLLRPRLQWALGLRAHAAVDDALAAIATNEPILLAGPAWCEQRTLAEEIHRRSPFRARDFVTAPATFETRQEQDAKLEHAARGTLYLDLTGATDPLPNHFVSSLFAGAIRPIVVASTEAQAEKMIDSYARRLLVIKLPPLAARREDIPRLLDALILQAGMGKGQAEPAPLAALGDDNVAGLKAYDWPGNFADVRRAVPRLHALLTNGIKLRPAARALGLKSVSSLIEALHRINVHMRPSDDDADEIDDADGSSADPFRNDELLTPPDAPVA